MTTAPAGRVARAAGQVAVITAIARVVGFARWLVFAATVGAAGVGTVYQSVNTIPNVVYEVAAGGVLAAVVVPLVAARVQGAVISAAAPSTPPADVPGGAGEHPDEVASALLTRALAVLVPLGVLLAVAAPWISELLLGDLETPGAVDLGTRLLLLFSPQVPLYGIGIVVSGVLQAHERFVAAALAPLLSSLVVIATYLGYAAVVPGGTDPATLDLVGTLVLGGGTTLGVVALSVPLLLAAGRAGIRLRPRWALPPGAGRRARDLAGAGLVGLVAQQAAVLVALKVANRSGGDGVVVVHQYVQALYLLPYAVLAVPVATAAFPVMSQVATQPQAATRTAGASLRTVVLLAGAAAAALVVAADPIGTVFAEIDAGRAGDALAALPDGLVATAPGLVGFALAAVATRALYARGRALAAGAAVGAGWLVVAGLPPLLLGPDAGAERTLTVLGAAGSLGMTVAAVGLILLLRRDWPAEVLQGVPAALAVALVAVLVGVGARTALSGRWPESLAPALVLGALAGLLALVLVLAVASALEPALRERLRGLLRGRGARRTDPGSER